MEDPLTEVTTEPAVETGTASVPVRSRKRGLAVVIVSSALLGALVGGSVVFLSVRRPAASSKPASVSTAPDALSPSAPRTQGASASSPLAAAKQLTAAGKLREAQEEYLSILLIDPAHEEAMRGLVHVVGLIAKADRAALRRQAEEYRRAVELGIETEEHYTAPAMELLARASLEAAGGRIPSPSVSSRTGPADATARTPAAAEPPSTKARARPERARDASPRTEPAPRASAQPEPEAVRGTAPKVPRPTAAPRRPAGPTAAVEPGTPPEDPGPPALLQIGPVSGPLANEIMAEVTLAGFSARVSSQGGVEVFRVLSNRMPANLASRRASELTASGFPARVHQLSGGFAQLDLGVFPTAEAAETVVSKVRAKGVDAASRAEGGPSRVITVGPYGLTLMNDVARTLRTKFSSVRIVVARSE